MSRLTQQPLDASLAAAEAGALGGSRGPPLHLQTAGASSYRAEMMRQDYRLPQFFQYDAHPCVVAGRGPPSWVPAEERAPPSAADRIGEVQAALEASARTMAEMERVEPHYDLAEVAMAQTQELLEKDRMVCRFRPGGWCTIPCAYATACVIPVQVLHFQAYTLEDVPYSRLENKRARIMEIFFHVPTQTLRVFEPAQTNSGLWQVRSGDARTNLLSYACLMCARCLSACITRC